MNDASKAIPESGYPPPPGLANEEPEFRREEDIPTEDEEPGMRKDQERGPKEHPAAS